MFFVKDNRKGYRQVSAGELKKMLHSAHRNITTASGYDGNLYHGTCADSSEDGPFRMSFVEKAENAFIEEHRLEILKNAAELVLRDIHALEAAK